MVLTEAEYARGSGAFDEIIATDVGPNKQRIYLYKKLACEDSDYLKAATRSEWYHGTIDLDDEDPIVVTTFAYWSASRTICIQLPTAPDMKEHPSVEISTMDDDQVSKLDAFLIAAYQFGQRRLCPTFQDAIISLLRIRFASNGIAMNTDNFTVAFSHDGSALKRLLTEQAVWLLYTGRDDILEMYQHPEFSMQIARAQQQHIIAKSSPQNPGQGLKLAPCLFHTHAPTKECSAIHFRIIITLRNDPFTYGRTVGYVAEGSTRIFRTTSHCAMGNTEGSVSSPPRQLRGTSVGTLEMWLQVDILRWRLEDIVDLRMKGADEASKDSLCKTILELAIHFHDTTKDIHNKAIDAFVHWTQVAGRLPSARCVRHVLHNVGKSQYYEFHIRAIQLLAVMYAWKEELVSYDNVFFLQMVIAAQSSLRDATRNATLVQRVIPNLAFQPWKDPYLCRNFHYHEEGASRQSMAKNRRDGATRDTPQAVWIEDFYKFLGERLQKLYDISDEIPDVYYIPTEQGTHVSRPTEEDTAISTPTEDQRPQKRHRGDTADS